ncbi:hypothetical protein GBAR_LOCUS22324 [Geodia barretti]|uniref:Uncharacterized protein n=1 Tax=Geodia barretti TaxID=519541 RepID=A0AA35T2J2_GEOBA|nr:hypothetical protein GBAR_LOCUS22324 [Geodia barretti]
MDRAMVRGNRGGCFSAVTRCVWGKPKEDLTRYRASESDTIEFEDIVTAENRAGAVHAKKQLVTEAERELLRSGKFDQLVEEQRRIDAERDAELRRQEEKLRQEEEVSVEVERQPVSQPDVVIHHQPRATPTSSSLPHLPSVSQLMSGSSVQEEDDFDQFLESVKARQLSITSSKAPEPMSVGTGDSGEGGGGGKEEEGEEEVDFGYWEKAEVPTAPETSGDPPHESNGKSTPLPKPPSRDMDLSLL